MPEGSKSKRNLVRNGLRAWAGGAIVLLLFLTPLLNYQVVQLKSSAPFFSVSSQRTLASVDPSWELRLSEQAAVRFQDELIGGSAKGPASLGRKPTSYDKLAFGVLEGRYQFHLESGKIKSIRLVNEDQLGAVVKEPQYLLEEFRSLFLIPYDKLSQRIEYFDQGRSVIIFDLLSKEDSRVGQASFIKDASGGLKSLSVKAL